jgi:hypothetical protein
MKTNFYAVIGDKQAIFLGITYYYLGHSKSLIELNIKTKTWLFAANRRPPFGANRGQIKQNSG